MGTDKLFIRFEKEDTNVCKAIAVLFMLWHHLFYLHPEIRLIGDIGEGIPLHLASFGKICVTIFTVLSGYGIMCGELRCLSKSWIEFQRNRTFKLYKKYLFVVIITLVIFWFFRETWAASVGTGLTMCYRIVLSLTGLQYIFLNMGINIVWWYMSMIFVCYLSFPILKPVVLKYPIWVVLGMIAVIPLAYVNIPRFGGLQILSWASGFYIGVLLADQNRLNNFVNKIVLNSLACKLISVLMMLLCIFRVYYVSYAVYTRYIDVIITILLMLRIAASDKKDGVIRRGMEYIGNISMDLYFIHMIFVEYITKNFTYSLTDSLQMFFVVLIGSIAAHYLLDIIRYFMFKIITVSKFERVIDGLD